MAIQRKATMQVTPLGGRIFICDDQIFIRVVPLGGQICEQSKLHVAPTVWAGHIFGSFWGNVTHLDLLRKTLNWNLDLNHF